MYQVKCLYDTFHEPFKRVAPVHGPVSENPVAEPTGSASGSKRKEDEIETQGPSKQSKKEPEISVKSALKAAFAKYKDKRVDKLEEGKMKKKIVAAEQENDDDDFA